MKYIVGKEIIKGIQWHTLASLKIKAQILDFFTFWGVDSEYQRDAWARNTGNSRNLWNFKSLRNVYMVKLHPSFCHVYHSLYFIIFEDLDFFMDGRDREELLVFETLWTEF